MVKSKKRAEEYSEMNEEPIVYGGSEYGKSDNPRASEDQSGTDVVVPIGVQRDIIVTINKRNFPFPNYNPPVVSREYPEDLKGYVREREHLEFVDDINEEINRKLGGHQAMHRTMRIFLLACVWIVALFVTIMSPVLKVSFG
uniref:Uncharacterized protein n=1 Tax=Paramoeba aestuarina TaxID=180227 RepID=A0A7S4NZ01_9EUKA|mmetsp:Transcript_31930/g.50001  ORF Transcript_31930/g.50001 Transcript_31930/m.50001 type:complete len:142 (+) Transcript_31930:169-594(+)